MYRALGVTTVTYVLIALGVFGTLTVDEVVGYGETAIAEAARPALGDAGFTMMAIAALLATASSVNATLYASGRPHEDARRASGSSRRSSGAARGSARTRGLLITAGARARRRQPRRPVGDRLVGSACSLVIFVLVGARRRYRLRADTGASASLIVLAIAVDRRRARLLRGRHAAQRSRDVRRDRR